jgi:hypothetical protein
MPTKRRWNHTNAQKEKNYFKKEYKNIKMENEIEKERERERTMLLGDWAEKWPREAESVTGQECFTCTG